jgi:cysteine-rich repeat protein
MRPIRNARWAALLLAVAMVPASATFHFMKIAELFPGTAAAPSAHYVVLQMYASGQNFVAGHEVTVHDASGQVVQTLTFQGDVPNGDNQARILLATPQAEAFFGLDADLAMGASLLKAGGKVCFAGSIDCVAWGGYAGGSSGVGTPFNTPSGLESGRAIRRRLDIAGSPATLDAGDDTGNSANDFLFAMPAPRNNAGVLGSVPGATCGNHALEGLEQCDDGNLSNGDGCSSTCRLDGVVSRPLPRTARAGDFNGDGRADVLWRNNATGANAIWLSANKATQQGIAPVTNLDWSVAGIGRFDAGGRSDVLWRNTATGANAIWLSGNRATQRSIAGVTNLAWKIVGIGDFNGDGRSDVFWRNAQTGANTIWKSANQQTLLGVATVADPDWQVVGIGDFNGDGRADVLWRNATSGANAIWRSASKQDQQGIFGVTNLDWKVAGTGDANGDGRSDVVWRNSRTGANAIWLSADRASQPGMAGVTNVAWEIVQMGDYGEDGRSDVFWRNVETGVNVIWKSASKSDQQSVSTVSNLDWAVEPQGD